MTPEEDVTQADDLAHGDDAGADGFTIVMTDTLMAYPLHDGSGLWVASDGWSWEEDEAGDDELLFDVLCEGGGRRLLLETLRISEAAFDPDWPTNGDECGARGLVERLQPQMVGAPVESVPGWWFLPLNGGGRARIAAHDCHRDGDALVFTLRRRADGPYAGGVPQPDQRLVTVQLPIGLIVDEVERELLATGHPPAGCIAPCVMRR